MRIYVALSVAKRPQGIEAKRQWLSDRLKESHVFRKLNLKDDVFKAKSMAYRSIVCKKSAFEIVDTTDNVYELLALSFDGTTPKSARNAKSLKSKS